MRKSICMLAVLAALWAFPLSAESSAQQDMNEAWEQLKEDGLRFLSGLSGAIEDAGKSIDEQLRGLSTAAFAGSWQFVNGKCTTTIDCRADGTMTVTQTERYGSKSWSGTYGVSVGTLEFSVKERKSEELFIKSTKQLDETWVLSYSLFGPDGIHFSSDDIPDDGNGYDFSRLTLFAPSVTSDGQ